MSMCDYQMSHGRGVRAGSGSKSGERGSCPGQHFLGGGTFGVLGDFVRNVLLQTRFKCLAFAKKCLENAGNTISDKQISNLLRGGTPL